MDVYEASRNMRLHQGSYRSLQHTALCLFKSYGQLGALQTNPQFAAQKKEGAPREEHYSSLKIDVRHHVDWSMHCCM